MDYVADTTFLIGLWRRQSWALQFATRNTGKSLGISWVVLGEFRHGALRAGHDEGEVESFLRLGNPILDPLPVIPVYARLCAEMQEGGTYSPVGQNDLWIGAIAISAGRPLLTRNRRHFDAMPGLKLELLEG